MEVIRINQHTRKFLNMEVSELTGGANATIDL
jgi:hypothetical protein